jgi:hypothetical protein
MPYQEKTDNPEWQRCLRKKRRPIACLKIEVATLPSKKTQASQASRNGTFMQ